MEDQQPAADDLTEANSDASDAEPDSHAETDDQATQATEAVDEEPGSGDVAPAAADQSEQADGGDTDSEKADSDAEAAGDGAGRKVGFLKRLRGKVKRPSGKRVAAAVAVVGVLLFVGSAAFAGATLQPYLADRAVVAVKLNVARTAANAITTLWTYTPENMDKLADRAAVYLSGDFGAQYRKFVDSIVAPNKQAKVTNNTEVTGVAVESLDGPNAVAIVYTNTTTTSPLTKNIPAMKYLSYRLIMKRDNSRWFVTRMTTITSLDLTPRL
ncbi:mammalian cell entry protein [Mycobacterium kansasii]|uniref:mammalian cell entry protein n=1 Tax=Mycobacterium kansasii TaxID=1768 RepID=UPI000CDD92EA|nr:mammalian cell entry protein [Mycobacterium kansasii]POX99682.1 mammalian cell entry protein [Mycobacterium kansasii]POY26207.1 mammalian cell entry protein [Mycobacterium kansasii]POY31887.1 mammalian cell entry protein [Mycobacterium kansasii]